MVSFPVDKSAISHSVRLSNGWVHYLDRPTLPIANKLVDVYIQGEEPYGFSASVTERTFHRVRPDPNGGLFRSEEHTSELQSLMRISYAVFCLKKKKTQNDNQTVPTTT